MSDTPTTPAPVEPKDIILKVGGKERIELPRK